ncbi:Frag1/DRAM/Sfk1 family-domain-containing protein [Armillaria luteobubalina]|uniref:Frag1/DRAM/Sfk1 family-domain-containing protein n=1 Tax=Armillaria luteobubalina TaxID=153913 RepID=A0AA39Q372_9AGAR|nr:Frag1/DRAM/Sfk1 family-domain-containing protein [Armillaria luteobubalina]
MSSTSFSIPASHIARAHTCLAAAAFLSALFVGTLLHYKKIVKNGVAGYPQEWFPSVSATIGDWYPERNLFQILIALTSGPRFGLVAAQYLLHRSSQSTLPIFVFILGLVRTLSCGGWVYITSSDDHDVHDFFMITYMVCNIPWMLGGIACTPQHSTRIRRKRFFTTIIPLVYFFIQHKVHRIPGAYTRYSFFEWGLIFFDVFYDSIAEAEFKDAALQISLNSLVVKDQTHEEIRNGTVVPVKESETASVSTLTPKREPASFKVLTVFQNPVVSFISDVYLSYIFWSIFTSLTPTLFYFSVWELGIAGHELALLSVLSPFLLSVDPLLRWARTRPAQIFLHFLSLSGLVAYLLQKPLQRLFVVAFATSMAVLRQTADWAASDEYATGYQSMTTGLGLLLSSLLKHANHSNNPVWPFLNEQSGGHNKTGVALALLCLVELLLRPTFEQRTTAHAPTQPSNNWFLGAVPLGSMIFVLHSLFSDASTTIAWSWTGYENGQPRGPLPHLHGSLTLVSQSLGLFTAVLLSSDPGKRFNFTTHPLWLAFGAGSSYVMYRYRNWLGYSGGLGLGFFVMSTLPAVLQLAASTRNVAKTYFTAMLVYVLLSLASVWTVAYAFVPGGVYLRERSDLTCAFLLLGCISTLSVLATLYRIPSSATQPWRAGPRVLRTGIWTLHFGIDNAGRDSQRRVRDVIRDLELDVVGFLETDLHRTVFGNRDLTRVIIEDLGYNVDIGPGPNSHTWGAVLLSKFPIINSTHHLLPSPHGELAPAIEAVLDVFGTYITVIVSHNGQEEDPLDRELQSKELARIMASSYPRPVIFLGYVVTKPGASRPNPYEILTVDGQMHDIDDEDEDRWCEYILYRGVYRTSYARVSRGTITDTELQVGQFLLPRHGTTVVNDTHEARYLRSHKEYLPEEHWFPMSYYGNKWQGGVSGHFYHVFNTPLYYQIPEDAVL